VSAEPPVGRALFRGAAYAGGMEPDVILAAREAELEAELAELTRLPAEIGSISFGKRVGEGTSMAVDRLAAVSTQEALLTMLDEVRRARRLVVEGRYGICEVCGEPIPEGRLEARPWATRCVKDG
jgi:DnaK suppressor protein